MFCRSARSASPSSVATTRAVRSRRCTASSTNAFGPYKLGLLVLIHAWAIPTRITVRQLQEHRPCHRHDRGYEGLFDERAPSFRPSSRSQRSKKHRQETKQTRVQPAVQKGLRMHPLLSSVCRFILRESDSCEHQIESRTQIVLRTRRQRHKAAQALTLVSEARH